jgi:hypothetical protein
LFGRDAFLFVLTYVVVPAKMSLCSEWTKLASAIVAMSCVMWVAWFARDADLPTYWCAYETENGGPAYLNPKTVCVHPNRAETCIMRCEENGWLASLDFRKPESTTWSIDSILCGLPPGVMSVRSDTCPARSYGSYYAIIDMRGDTNHVEGGAYSMLNAEVYRVATQGRPFYSLELKTTQRGEKIYYRLDDGLHLEADCDVVDVMHRARRAQSWRESRNELHVSFNGFRHYFEFAWHSESFDVCGVKYDHTMRRLTSTPITTLSIVDRLIGVAAQWYSSCAVGVVIMRADHTSSYYTKRLGQELTDSLDITLEPKDKMRGVVVWY